MQANGELKCFCGAAKKGVLAPCMASHHHHRPLSAIVHTVGSNTHTRPVANVLKPYECYYMDM